VTDIVRAAVLGSYGVAGFATPDPWGYLVRWLGLGEPGIRIGLDDLRVELHIRVAYGLPVAEVARQVESAVRYALRRDLDREPSEVAIHIDGLVERDRSMPIVPPTEQGETEGDPAAVAEPAAPPVDESASAGSGSGGRR
jgi:uncharacterized alkaline shock family protein YloU